MDKENLLMVNDGETVFEDVSVSEDATDKEVMCDNERKEDANSKTEKGNKKYKDSIKELSEYLEEESGKKNVYIQYRIYNNHGVMAGNEAQFENIYFKDSMRPGSGHDSGSVFKEQGALVRWLSDNYGSYSMTLMIATAVFDSFPYTWIIRASERLFQMFEHHEEMERTDALVGI